MIEEAKVMQQESAKENVSFSVKEKKEMLDSMFLNRFIFFN